MGYDVHITRATDWTQNSGLEIRLEEWQGLFAADPQLEPDPDNGPGAVLWSAHPEGKEDAWLDWSKGNVYSTNPDEPLIKKMCRVALDLDARVQGDDGRIYSSNSDANCGEDHG